MMTARRLVAGLVLLIFLAIPVLADEPAPEFSLKTSDGKSIEMKALAGKVVVVNFWATWCGPCRAEIPGFLEVYDKYKAKGLEIVGISVREEWAAVKPFIERQKITYPIVIAGLDLFKAYGGTNSIPTTVIVDRKGNIVKRHVGGMTKAQLEEMVKGLL